MMTPDAVCITSDEWASKMVNWVLSKKHALGLKNVQRLIARRSP